MAKVIALLSLCQACANPTVKTPFDPGCHGERGSIPGAFSSHDFRLHNLVWSSLLKILKTLQFSYFRICGKIELMLCRGLRSQPIILRIPHGKAFSRRTWTSIWARGKRRGFSPGAVARHRSRTRDSLIMSFSSVLFWSGFLFPLLFSLFAEIAPPIFFPMKLDKDSGCISVIFGPSATAFRFKNRKKTQFFEIGLLLKKLNLLRSDNYRLGPISDFSGKNAQETSDYKKSQKTYQKSELKIRRDSGPTRAVAKGLKPLRLPRAPTWILGFWNISGYLGRYGIQIDPSVTEQIDPTVTEPELRPEPVLSLPWNKVYYNINNMYSQSHLGLHFRKLLQSSKLKGRTSLFTETWQKREWYRVTLWYLHNSDRFLVFGL